MCSVIGCAGFCHVTQEVPFLAKGGNAFFICGYALVMLIICTCRSSHDQMPYVNTFFLSVQGAVCKISVVFI